MAKKVIDRVFKTIMIVIDVLYGTAMTFYGLTALFRSSYEMSGDWIPMGLSFAAIVIANGINIVIRRWIRNY